MPAISHPPEQLMEAFELTISVYQEKVAASGMISAMNYGQGAESGKATNTGSSQTITASDSDFICDVELAARRSLLKGDHSYWLLYYKSLDLVVAPSDTELLAAHIDTFPEHQRAAVASIDKRMRETLGEELLRIKVSPMSVYRKSVDVRAPRKPKGWLSHLDGTHI